ncbi:hypothetical protein EV426DRAFT_515317, partial [Tirmania nivea]
GWEEVVLMLLERGANVNGTGDEYWSTLCIACCQRKMDIISLLSRRGRQRCSGKFGTALVAAASTGKVEVVSLLLECGANLNIVSG